MNSSFRCLVIGGIADYADGDKNDIWHEYAAAAAALYVRELILNVPTATVGELDELISSLNKIDHELIASYDITVSKRPFALSTP